ncbi:hypothetical protein L0Y46_03725 [bacterium]|nr:hypothetical protein [bacterium]MCI0679966.1 hypothetical protein [bacterium]
MPALVANALLAELEKRSWETVTEFEHEIGQKLLVAPKQAIVEEKSTRIVAGFPVIGTRKVFVPSAEEIKKREQALIARRNFLRNAREMKEHVLGRLAQAGLSPIAVVPEKVWDTLCAKAGLYRFESISKDGTVLANFGRFFSVFVAIIYACCILMFACAAAFIYAPLSWWYAVAGISAGMLLWQMLKKDEPLGFFDPIGWFIQDQCLSRNLEAFFIFSLLGFITGFPFAMLALPLTGTSVWGVAGAVAAGALCSTVLFLSINYVFSDERRGLRIVLKLLRILPRSFLARLLWPGGRDTGSDIVTVRFPEPPADVVEVLDRARGEGYRINVATVPRAIGLDYEGISYGVAQKLVDPVIYVRECGMVAVLAQFGDFKVEKKVIAEATARSNCINLLG